MARRRGRGVALAVSLAGAAFLGFAVAGRNFVMEHQTAVDTTTGSPLPLGLRGATQADVVA